MDILLMIWLVVDSVLLIILPLRNKVPEGRNMMWRRSIESIKSLSSIFMGGLSKIIFLMPICLIIYAVICIVPSEIIQRLLEWYKGIFIVGLFPVFVTWVIERNINIKSIWNICLTVLTVLFSVLGYIIDIENMETVFEHRGVLNVLMTVFVATFIIAFCDIRKESNEYYSKKLPKKGIRKDLYHRTPGLAVNVSNIELIRHCEKYFDQYMRRYRKIKGLHTIEYVNLAGVHRGLWYAQTVRFMKKLVVVSIFCVAISLSFGISYKHFVVLGLVIIFGVLISIYKYVDMECLYKLGIRYFYDEWGYYLTCTSKCKFVGNVQMIELSKFHRYIHSFLDIVALCRAVAFCDKTNGEKRISIITSNLSELFENYSDYMEKANWVMVIPLWTAVLFEFYVTNEINEEAKTILLKSVDGSVRADVSIFLQSVWADMERKKLEDGILRYIQLFEEKLYN